MSQLGWVIVENIVIYTLMAATFIFAPEWWKLLGLSFLLALNVYGGKKNADTSFAASSEGAKK